jgi:hypothetical protein
VLQNWACKASDSGTATPSKSAETEAEEENSAENSGGLAIETYDGPLPNSMKLTEVSTLVAEATPDSLQTGSLAIGAGLRSRQGAYDKSSRPVQGNTRTDSTSYITLAFDNPTVQCANGGHYDSFTPACDPGADQLAFTFMVDIRCRLYHSGPTEIAKWMANLDEQVDQLETRTTDSYYPCADRSHADYVLTEIPTTYSFLDRNGNAQNINLGFNYYLSCLASDDEYSSGFGQKDDGNGGVDTYYYSAQHSETNSMGSVAKVDASNNVDFWTSLPNVRAADDYADLSSSAGLIHIKTSAASGIYEMSFTGTGVGPGCGVKLISNGTYLYAKTNQNSDKHCIDNSGLVGGPAYDANLIEMEYCLKVDVAEAISSVNMSNCIAANLTEADITISYLNQGILEAYNAAKIFSTAPTGVAAFSGTPIDELLAGTPAATLPSGQYTCNQAHQQNYSKNCSTLFEAPTLQDAIDICGRSEAAGGQGCCQSSRVYTNNYGPVVSYEVVPLGSRKGEGTTTSCDP